MLHGAGIFINNHNKSPLKWHSKYTSAPWSIWLWGPVLPRSSKPDSWETVQCRERSPQWTWGSTKLLQSYHDWWPLADTNSIKEICQTHQLHQFVLRASPSKLVKLDSHTGSSLAISIQWSSESPMLHQPIVHSAQTKFICQPWGKWSKPFHWRDVWGNQF